MDIIYLFKVLVRRKWTILFCLLAGLLGGTLFRIIIPERIYFHRAVFHGVFTNTKSKSSAN